MSDHIQVLNKNGPHNKWFDSRAAELTCAIYASELGGSPVTKKVVRTMNIQYVLWIKDMETEKTIAAAMVMRFVNGDHRICGIAVDPSHKRKGYGTALMRKIESLMPDESSLCLGVDKDKEATQWLLEWYTSLGFQRIRETSYEFILEKTIAKGE